MVPRLCLPYTISICKVLLINDNPYSGPYMHAKMCMQGIVQLHMHCISKTGIFVKRKQYGNVGYDMPKVPYKVGLVSQPPESKRLIKDYPHLTVINGVEGVNAHSIGYGRGQVSRIRRQIYYREKTPYILRPSSRPTQRCFRRNCIT